MAYLKQFALCICFTSTIILWGTAFKLDQSDIMAVAIFVGIIQWISFLGDTK